MNYITKEFKKLTSMAFIIIGAFLMLEHIYSYGGIHLLDFLGHEWIGIYFILTGIFFYSCENGSPGENKHRIAFRSFDRLVWYRY